MISTSLLCELFGVKVFLFNMHLVKARVNTVMNAVECFA